MVKHLGQAEVNFSIELDDDLWFTVVCLMTDSLTIEVLIDDSSLRFLRMHFLST